MATDTTTDNAKPLPPPLSARERWTPKRIKALRERKGWTQVDLAAVLGVAPTTVARWECRMIRRPSKLVVEKLERL